MTFVTLSDNLSVPLWLMDFNFFNTSDFFCHVADFDYLAYAFQKLLLDVS